MPRSLHRCFIVFTTACTFLLLIAGALVTSTGEGLSVPTWLFAPSGILPFPVAITVAHVINGALTLAAAVWLSLVASRLFGRLGEWNFAPAPVGHDGGAVSVRTS